MKNDIMALEGQFYRSLGDGVKAGQLIAQMVASVVKHRDTTVITRAIKRAGSKSDKTAANVLRFCFSQVFPDAKIKKDKKTDTLSILIKDTEADEEALSRLMAASAAGYSIRGPLFRKTVKGEADEKDKITPDEARTKLLNYMTRLANELEVDIDVVRSMAAAKPTNKEPNF